MPPGDPFVSTAGVALLALAPAAIVTRARAAWPQDAATCRTRLDLTRRQGFAVRTHDDGTVSIGIASGSPAVAAIAVSNRAWGEADALAILPELRRQAAAIAAPMA